ncbi:hypothetical protein AMEX_G1077 [Astyanax mexicanus]|uniref:Uncharacterized protein n=1 Tax=Astyanax mexicanus TaxID=7994 RepID=A0A8T2MLT3_ASTMX|nr:hypothetical protein AMEX_G1077 [Astyanax mexicanus]
MLHHRIGEGGEGGGGGGGGGGAMPDTPTTPTPPPKAPQTPPPFLLLLLRDGNASNSCSKTGSRPLELSTTGCGHVPRRALLVHVHRAWSGCTLARRCCSWPCRPCSTLASCQCWCSSWSHKG